MPRGSRNLRTRHLLWVVLGFFCCALITLGGIVQAGHMHADGQAVQSDCALCHVAHLVVQPSVPQVSAAHRLCRGQGIDCPAADSCSILFCILPLHPASACTDCQLLSSSVSKIRNLRRLLMRMPTRSILSFVLVFVFSAMFWPVQAQSNSGSISGTVTDPSGAVVPGATVTVENPVSGYLRTTKTDSTGRFQFSNLPFNPYHLTAYGHGLRRRGARCRCAIRCVRECGDYLESSGCLHNRDRREWSRSVRK